MTFYNFIVEIRSRLEAANVDEDEYDRAARAQKYVVYKTTVYINASNKASWNTSKLENTT